MTTTKLSKIAVAAAMFSLCSATGNATILSSGSDTMNFTWSYDTGGAAGTLTGSGSIVASGFNSSSLLLTVSLSNTSIVLGDRLTSFGFGIDPNATSVAFSDVADGGMVGASLSSIPSLATIEVCAYGGPNCSGGGNGGILPGGSDSFALTLGGTWGSTVNIDPLGYKFQTALTSYEFTSSSSSTSSSSTSSSSTSSSSTSSGQSSGTIPEPGTVSLLGLGLLGQVWLLRQRRRRLQQA